MNALNERYSPLSVRQRYEVWFLRLALADGSGAWWFRYLLLNPGRGGCITPSNSALADNEYRAMPVQIWATWFPRNGRPETVIQGFSLKDADFSERGKTPFHFHVGPNIIQEASCRGELVVNAHSVSWDLRYRSNFQCTLSNKGWVGFSRTPHSDAVFSGRITLDGHVFEGDPLGFGLQGHNCGYRHRGYWRWAHAYFPCSDGNATTIEALIYDMPLGLVFRKAVLWHEGRHYAFRNVKEIARGADEFQWKFQCSKKNQLTVEAFFDGTGPEIHRLPYLKTDCSGNFEVTNNSLSRATLHLKRGDQVQQLSTEGGAVLEMAGRR